MGKFREFIDTLESGDGVDYFVVKISREILERELSLIEGIWVDSKKKGYMLRLDPPRPEINQQRHVHIAKKEHTAAKGKQVSWNQDMSKHDSGNFNSNIGSQVIVQDIAKQALGLPANAKLEEETVSKGKKGYCFYLSQLM